MPLSNQQISELLEMVATSHTDQLDCDSCYDRLAEFADAKLASNELPDALKAVEVHLTQCRCCKDEFQALLEGLRALEDD